MSDGAAAARSFAKLTEQSHRVNDIPDIVFVLTMQQSSITMQMRHCCCRCLCVTWMQKTVFLVPAIDVCQNTHAGIGLFRVPTSLLS